MYSHVQAMTTHKIDMPIQVTLQKESLKISQKTLNYKGICSILQRKPCKLTNSEKMQIKNLKPYNTKTLWDISGLGSRVQKKEDYVDDMIKNVQAY